MKYTSLFILTIFLIFLATNYSCKGEESTTDIPSVTDSTLTLKEASPFPFGAALSISKMKNQEIYLSTVKNEFNSITAENAMKMVNLAPSQKDMYTWNDADYFVNFALANNMRIHGHCLVWHNSLPGWVTNFSGTKEEWKNMLKNYITTVVSRYKGKIASWDVVNEILLDDGTPRQNIWYTKIGWEYVALAFKTAHEADPAAILFYNEYGQEYSKIKLMAINDTVKSLIKQGVPIQGIGLQMHTNINQTAVNMVNAIQQTALTGLIIHISELDIALNQSKNTNYLITDVDLNTQKSRYRSIATAMRQIPKAQNWGITTWGVSDNDSWLTPNPDFPLLFDKNFKKKACYYGVLEAFATK
jgi:endo-1,4-beta-xylanase